MNVDRDKSLIEHIKNHYAEMQDELNLLNDSFDEFENNSTVRKAINFDVLQIGENFSHLSDEVLKLFNMNDIRGIIDIRNFVAHGYVINRLTNRVNLFVCLYFSQENHKINAWD